MGSSPSKPLYREVPLRPELAPYAEAAWLLVVPNAPPPLPHRVLPDGCTDIVGQVGGELVVAGPSTRSELASLVPGRAHYGIRFRPGMAEVIFGVSACELRNGGAALDAVWSGTRLDRCQSVIDIDDAEDALAELQAVLSTSLRGQPETDPIVGASIDLLSRRESASVAGLGRELGVSDRQLRRRFDRAVGYGPKQLARILRFQRALALAQQRERVDGAVRWSDVAAVTGYADQSHLVHEWNELSGQPPTDLVASRPTLAS